MKSIHPYPPFIPKGAKRLIIGTIPPSRFCTKPQNLYPEDVNFYYGSRDNYFWPLIAKIMDKKLCYENNEFAIIERTEVLEDLKIGITDIIDMCIHNNNSASDIDIKEIKLKDLRKLLVSYEDIDTLIYTSEFVKKIINRMFGTYHSIDKQNIRKQTVKINDKTYRVRVLFSPSPQALINMGKEGHNRRIQQYREFLLED